jgi:hypothetical protein
MSENEKCGIEEMNVLIDEFRSRSPGDCGWLSDNPRVAIHALQVIGSNENCDEVGDIAAWFAGELIKTRRQLAAAKQQLAAPLLCDSCGRELQREACNHVRPCECHTNKIFGLQQQLAAKDEEIAKEKKRADEAEAACAEYEASLNVDDKAASNGELKRKPNPGQPLLDRAAKMEELIVALLNMGGTPDLFAPDCGWDDWIEQARALIGKEKA